LRFLRRLADALFGVVVVIVAGAGFVTINAPNPRQRRGLKRRFTLAVGCRGPPANAVVLVLIDDSQRLGQGTPTEISCPRSRNSVVRRPGEELTA
jgi:hypothetical protein